MVSIVLIAVSNLLYGMLFCSVFNSNKLNVYGKKIVNYVTLEQLRYPSEE